MSTPDSWCIPEAETPPEPPYRGALAEAAINNSLCSTDWSEPLITGFLVDLLVQHFADPLSIESPDLRHLVWRPEERTEILIEEASRWVGSLVEKRPAVIVKRNACRSVRLVRKDLAGQDQRTGARSFVKLWVGSHTLFCIHRSGLAADYLAVEVRREVGQFAETIKEELGLHDLQVVEVGAATEIEEATESYAVPVTVGWSFQETWEVARVARPLKISLRRICGC